LVFGDVSANDLIFHFAVFEEKEKRDGFHIVLHSKAASVIDIDLGNFRLAFDFARKLVENGTDHFAGAAPFSPEIDKYREIGIDHFGLETIFGKVECHAGNLKPVEAFVKGAKRKILGVRIFRWKQPKNRGSQGVYSRPSKRYKPSRQRSKY
jgi:hypothetical protein